MPNIKSSERIEERTSPYSWYALAQVLASLNPSNIATIYGVEEHDGFRALELVEGPTLADRISAGAIPFEKALPIARQIAEALEVVHERNIIHRDPDEADFHDVERLPDGHA
jgi:serine/threonine protein kinase